MRPRHPGGGLTALALFVPFVLAAALPSTAAAAPAATSGEAVRVMRTGGLRVETAALLLSGQQGGGIPLAILAFPLPGKGERARVPIVIEAAGSGLLAGMDEAVGVEEQSEGGSKRNELRLDVAVYALTSQGGIAASFAETIEIDRAKLDATLERTGLQFVGELALLPGDYSLRVLVRNPLTKNLGLKVAQVSVPAFKDLPLLTTPLFLPPPATQPAQPTAAAAAAAAAAPVAPAAPAEPGPEGWLTVHAVASDLPPGPSPLPLLLDGDRAPAALPLVAPAAGTGVTLELPGYRLTGAPINLRVEVRQRDGVMIADLPAHGSAPRDGGAPGLTVIAVAFDWKSAPALPPGEYELRVTAPGAVPLRSLPLPFLVGTQAEGRVWASLAPGGAGGGQGALDDASQGPHGRRSRAIDSPSRAAFRAALKRLSGGDEDGARIALSDLEGSLVEKSGFALDDLAALEVGVVRELTKSNPEGLVPILALYSGLYADELQRKRYYLSAHSREMVFGLADFYAEKGGTAAARSLAGRFLAAFGAEIARQTGTGSLSQRAFARSLVLDEGNETTRLCLAIEAERRGEYSAAIALLRRLLTAHPESAEAKLRLAVNVARVGREKEAEQLLGAVAHAAVGPPPWVALLAFQELGRLQLAGGQAREAEKTVRDGLGRYPRDQKLLSLLALLLDLRGQEGEAQGVLADLAPQAQGDGARFRYTELPDELKEPLSSGLRQSVKERLPVLAAALGGAAAAASGGGR